MDPIFGIPLSFIENIIITITHDEIFKEELFADYLKNAAAKEVKIITLL